MYKALIIDDDISAIDSIYNAFDWKRLNVSQVVKINDTNNLTQVIQSESPDIVMIDIEMGDVSGLDIIESCRSIGNKALFVIISGHYNFSYAKTAIKLDVVYYLSKPILEYDVDEATEKIASRLNAKNGNSFEIIDDVNMLLSGKEGFCNYLKENHINFSKSYRFIIANANDRMLEEIGKLCLGDALHSKYKIGKNRYLFIVFVEKFTEEKEKRLKSVCSTRRISMGFSDEFSCEEDSYMCFKQACILSLGKFIYGRNDVFKNEVIDNNEFDKFSKQWFEYLENLEENTIDEFEKFIKSVPEYFIKYKFNFKQVVLFRNSLVYKINLMSKNMINDEYVSVLSEEDIVTEYGTLENMCMEFLIMVKEILEGTSTTYTESEDVFEKILKYLNNSYYINISLEELGKQFNVSVSYICKHFKEKLDTTYLEYLKSIRIIHAKRMLKNSNLSVTEIAEMVGYTDYYYFNKVFKAQTGYTPKQYKNI